MVLQFNTNHSIVHFNWVNYIVLNYTLIFKKNSPQNYGFKIFAKAIFLFLPVP